MQKSSCHRDNYGNTNHLRFRGTLYTHPALFSISGQLFIAQCIHATGARCPCNKISLWLCCGYSNLGIICFLVQSQSHVIYYYYKKLHGEVERMHAMGLDTCIMHPFGDSPCKTVDLTRRTETRTSRNFLSTHCILYTCTRWIFLNYSVCNNHFKHDHTESGSG